MAAKCKHQFEFNAYCGCHVCVKCDQHAHLNRETRQVTQTLARCYCGWSLSDPGNGLAELREFGEVV